MAYSPTEDYKIIYGKDQQEMETQIQAALDAGYEFASPDKVWNGMLADNNSAYRQVMIKKGNTDAQFISAQTASLKNMLENLLASEEETGVTKEDIVEALAPIQAQNTQIIELLTAIKTNTTPTPTPTPTPEPTPAPAA